MANEYLTRTPTSGGNRKIWTWSGWVKFGDIDKNDQVIYSAVSGSSYLHIRFMGVDPTATRSHKLNFQMYDGSTSYNIYTDRVLRDSGSWYHIFLSVDYTQSTAADRTKIYINNELTKQVDEVGTGSASIAAQNYQTYANLSGAVHNIGYHSTYGEYSSCNIFDLYLVDGQALTPDVFGFHKDGDGYVSAGTTNATDFRPGQWSPRLPRSIKHTINSGGGFGVNGFYLPLNDSSNPGADFHCTPNSMIKLKGEDEPQPLNGAPTTSDAYVSQLREEPGTLGFDGVVKFDGVDDYISFAGTNDFAFGTGDFTVEFTMLSSDKTANGFYNRLFCNDGPTGDVAGNLQFNIDEPTGALVIWNGTGNVLVGNTNLCDSEWHHVAVTRSGTALRIFVDGNQDGVATDSTNWGTHNSGSPRLYIGATGSGGGDGWYKGFLSNYRILKGTALYTANFTKPTAPLVNDVVNTKLLIFQSTTDATYGVVTPGGAGTVTANGGVFATKNELTGSIELAVPCISTATGANLITNGGFDDDISGWTVVDATVSWEWETGSIRIVPNSGVNGAVYQSITTVIGQRYSLSVDVVGANPIGSPPSPFARIHVGTTTDITLNERYLHTGQSAAHNVSIGHYTVSFTATTTTTTVWLEVGGGAQTQVDFDNVVVKQEDVPRDYSADIRGSGTNNTLTVTGNGGVGYALDSYYGSAMNFGGSADKLSFDNVISNPGNGDFTFEFWAAPDDWSGTYTGLLTLSTTTAADRFETAIQSNNIHVYTATGTWVDTGFEFPKEQWTHVAFERYNGFLTMYINGAARWVVANTHDYNEAWSSKQQFGKHGSGHGDYDGLLQDLRCYVGVAKYKGGFDVPKPYTARDSNSKKFKGDWRIISDASVNNFATFNPLAMVPAAAVGVSFSNGNLTVTGSAAYRSTPATMGMHSGKWYVEFYWNTWMNDCHLGIMNDLSPNITGTWAGTTAPGYAWAGSGGRLYNNGSIFGSFLHTFTTGDVCQIAFDADNGNLYFGKNGTWLDGANPSAGTGANWTGLTDGPYHFFVTTTSTSPVVTVNFGQNPSFCGSLSIGTEPDGNGNGLFKYLPPSGFLALCDNNLPAPAVADPGKHFKTVLYTGDGVVGRQITGVGFKPDLVWIKPRDYVDNNVIFNSIINYAQYTNSATAGNTSHKILDYGKSGFTLTDWNNANDPGDSYVAWCWKAGGAPVTNNDGSVTSTVSANPEAGFSMVRFTAQTSSSDVTVGHGLGKKPAFWIYKPYTNTTEWYMYHQDLGASAWVNFDGLVATTGNAAAWGTDPTDTVLTHGQGLANQGDCMMFVWAEIEGYSRIGSYTGNQDVDGPFVHCGFKPAFLMIKLVTGDGRDWHIYDSCRNSVNPVGLNLRPSSTSGENDEPGIDFLSNGFKIRKNYIFSNRDGDTIIFAAFAESPFKTANAK